MISSEMKKGKNITIMLPFVKTGGAEKVIFELSKYISEKKLADVTVVVVQNCESEWQFNLQSSGVRVVTLNHSGRLLSAGLKILKYIWRERPRRLMTTLVHFNLYMCYLSIFFPRNVKLIIREAAVMSEYVREKKLVSFQTYLHKIGYAVSHKIIVQSEDMLKDLAENFSVPRDRLIKIYNPVKINNKPVSLKKSRSSEEDEVLRLVAFGRLEYQKGYDVLIAACAQVDRKFILHIYGEGSQYEILKKQISDLKLDGKVIIKPFVTNPSLIMHEYHYLILPSRYEGLPNIVLEALTAGLPVIAHGCPGGVNEVLRHRDRCIVFSPLTVHKLIEAIVMAAKHNDFLHYDMRDFSIDQIAYQYLDVDLNVN